MTQAAVYKKIAALEREVQKMKLEAYRAIPRAQRPKSAYAEKDLARAARATRKDIWQRSYATKVTRIS